MTTLRQDEHGADFLGGGGELGRLIRAFDWSKTALGPIETWSSAVATTVGLILGSAVPMVTLWGEDGVMIYNDAYARFAGGRHPGLLGLPVREGWPEVSGFNDRVMKMVLAGGSLTYRDQEMQLSRSGAPEQVWLNLDYSPVVDEDGEPIGVIAIVVETTARILAERELKLEEAQREAERERLRRMLEQAPGLVNILRGPDHIVDFVNETHRRLFDSSGWIGRPVREAIPGVAGQGFFEILDSVYATGRTIEVESAPITYQRTPESPMERRYLTLMFAPSYDDADRVEGVFVLGFDVTEGAIARRRSAALARLADAIADADTPEAMAHAAAEIVAAELGVTRAGYAFIDEAAGTVQVMSEWTTPGLKSIERPTPLDSIGPALETLRSGAPVVIADVQQLPGTEARGEWLEAHRIRSVLN
ncbi:MAG TPA: PAS domain-containing protein, partial [Devosia sp.]